MVRKVGLLFGGIMFRMVRVEIVIVSSRKKLGKNKWQLKNSEQILTEPGHKEITT